MGQKNNIFHKLWFGSVDKTFFSVQNTIISKINSKTLRYLTILAFGFCSILALVYLIPAKQDPDYYKIALFYVISALLFGIDAILCFTMLARKNKGLHLLYWIFEVLSLINFIYVSVYCQKFNTSTIFFGIEMILPTVYLTKPWVSIVEHSIAYVIFIVCDILLKDKSILTQDLIYAGLFYFIANLVTLYIRSLSISSLEASILFRKESQLDKLTNLYNKSALDIYCKEAISNNKETIALILIDVDDFKLVNDRWGYNQGDEFLSKLASVLYRSFENIGIIGRVEGDEFMVLVENVFDKNLLEKRINIALDNISKVFLDYSVERITCSCGISYKEKNEVLTYDRFYKNAEQALEFAKNEGKNKAVIFSKNMVYNGKKNVFLISNNGSLSKRFNDLFESKYNIYDIVSIKDFQNFEMPHNLIDLILIDPTNIDMNNIINIKNQFPLLSETVKVACYKENSDNKSLYLNKGFDYFVDASKDDNRLKAIIKGILE